MKKTLPGYPALLLSIALILTSCLEELEKADKISGPSFQPAIEFPLINSDFSMEEFLTEGNSKARISETSGVMVLLYDDTVSTPSGDMVFLLPDQQSPTLSITGPETTFPSPGGSVTITKNLDFTITSQQGEALDSILVKAGQMLFELSSTFPADISLTIDIPSLKIQDAAFQQTFILNGPGAQSPSIDLEDAVFDLTLNGTTANTISFSISATITDTGQPINSTHRLDFNFSLNDLQFRGLFGDLGSHTIPLMSDSIDVDVFDNAFSGTVELVSPVVRLTMRNSFGIPLGFDIQGVSSIKNSTAIGLTGTAVEAPANPYRLEAPTYAQVGQTVDSEIELNSANSNLSELISSLPNYLSYDFGLTLNPAPVQSKNFVLDDSKLEIGVHVELPFYGRISALSLSKQYDFDGLGIEDIEQGKIKLKTVNELPLDAFVQVYFVDNSGTVLDSLFSDQSILEGAGVDADGFTQEGAEVITEVTVTKEKIDRIEQAAQLRITATLYTTDAGAVPVKFSSTDKLKINLGVNTRLEYNLN